MEPKFRQIEMANMNTVTLPFYKFIGLNKLFYYDIIRFSLNKPNPFRQKQNIRHLETNIKNKSYYSMLT